MAPAPGIASPRKNPNGFVPASKMLAQPFASFVKRLFHGVLLGVTLRRLAGVAHKRRGTERGVGTGLVAALAADAPNAMNGATQSVSNASELRHAAARIVVRLRNP